MPNIVNQELVKAFNIILCHNEIAITNFTVQNVRQSLRNKDHIVILFDKSMDADQCMKYLDNMKGRIVETFCGNESTASLSFDMKSFPFNFNRSQLVDSNGKYRFSVPIDQSIVFNLKCLLANGLARDITGAMGRDFGLEHVEGYTSDEIFDRKSYLYCMRFYDKRLQEYFIESFSATVKGYKNSPKRTDDFLKVKDNCVYIKASIFDDVKFIKNIIKHKASLECRDFEVPSSEDENVENLKFPIIALLRRMGIPADTILHTSYTGSGENSVLVPIIQMTSGIGGKENCRLLNKEEVNYVNRAFGMDVLRNVQDYTSPKHLPVFGNGGVYGIDFYDKDISYCVLNKIVESSVINKRHELAIDPELPRTLLAEASPTRGCPKRSRGEGLEKHPRQGSEREEETEPFRGVLGEEIGQASTSSQQTDMPSSSYTYIDKRDESMPEDSYFLPSMLTSFPHVITPLVHSVLTTRHDPMFPNHEFFARSSCFEDKNILSMKSEEHDKSEQGACSQVGVRESLPLEGAQADDESMPIEIRDQQVRYRPSLTPFPTAWNDSMSLNSGVSEDSPKDTANICNKEPEKQQVTDESDRKSSNECSEAKSQESESPKKHGGGLRCSQKGSESNSSSGSSTPSKVRQSSILESLENTSFERNSQERDSVYSSASTPVTEPDDGGFPNRPKIRALRSETNGGISESLPQDAVSKPNVPGDRNSKISKDSGFESLERPQSNSSITTSTVPGISESRKDLNPPVDNKRPKSLPLADFSTCASNETVKAFLCFLDYFSSPEGKKQLPSLLSSEVGKQLSSISDPCEQENLLDFLFSTEGSKQLCSLFSSENKQQLHSLFSLKGKELLFSPSPEGQKLIPSVLSPKGKEKLPLLLSPEGERISKPFSPEAGNIISLLIYSRVEPKNMSHRSFRDKLAKWLHCNSSLSKVASPQEKPLTNDEKKELRPFLCPKLQKKLDSNSLEDAQLKYLLYTPGGKKKLDLLPFPPEKEGKQLLSGLQKIGGNASTSFADSGCYSGSSSQKSTSDTGSDEDELEASGRSSVSSNSSTSTVRTKMDATKIEQYLQEGKEVFV